MFNLGMSQSVSKSIRFLAMLVLIIVTTSVYYQNSPRLVRDEWFFGQFQKDSEALVIGKIIADKHGHEIGKNANLGFASEKSAAPESVVMAGYDLLDKPVVELAVRPYVSNYGLQGLFYSAVYKVFGLSSSKALNLLSAVLTAMSVVVLSFLFSKVVSRPFGIVFCLTLIFSPWMASFAKNLYWSPYTWFLPPIFASIAYLSNRRLTKILALSLYFLAVIVKCLMGYEYISTIIWLSCAPFLLDIFLPSSKYNWRVATRQAAVVFFVGVVGFSSALIMHAQRRGDSIGEGLNSIWVQDVKRRTYGDPGAFKEVYTESLNASAIQVLGRYIKEWHTPLLTGISGKAFAVLIVLSVFAIVYGFWKSHPMRWRNLGLCAVFVVGPVTWYVLAKSHSYIHLHMNFVLWYFGYVAALFFVVGSVAMPAVRRIVFQKRGKQFEQGAMVQDKLG